MKLVKPGLCVFLLAIFLIGCATTKGTTPCDKRRATVKGTKYWKDDALN